MEKATGVESFEFVDLVSKLFEFEAFLGLGQLVVLGTVCIVKDILEELTVALQHALHKLQKCISDAIVVNS